MRKPIFPVIALAAMLAACSGGSSDAPGDASGDASGDAPGGSNPPQPPIAPVAPGPTLDDPDADTLDPGTADAFYRVTLENFWGAADYPQEFPDDAHLSLVAGAVHDDEVTFWAIGDTVSRGMEDIAEAGLIDIFLLDEVTPAVAAGTAYQPIEYRTYTGPMVDGEPGISTFDIQASVGWSRLTLATMLGPSPDWFVGVSGLALDDATGWRERIVVDLPLLDGGTKSDIIPVMGGPDIRPPEPIGYVVYDPATGTYQPSDVAENVARLTLQRIR